MRGFRNAVVPNVAYSQVTMKSSQCDMELELESEMEEWDSRNLITKLQYGPRFQCFDFCQQVYCFYKVLPEHLEGPAIGLHYEEE